MSDDHDHDELHLELHREADELGKYAMKVDVCAPNGLTKEMSKEFIDRLMRSVTASCVDKGADLVGHIKSFFYTPHGNLMSSIVEVGGATVIKDGMEDGQIDRAELILHVIVHGIWDPDVREATLSTIPAIFQAYGLNYDVTEDYYEVEKSIDHHL